MTDVTQWLVRKADGRDLGPLSTAELHALIADAGLDRADLIRRNEMPEWQCAADVPGLFTPPPYDAAGQDEAVPNTGNAGFARFWRGEVSLGATFAAALLLWAIPLWSLTLAKGTFTPPDDIVADARIRIAVLSYLLVSGVFCGVGLYRATELYALEGIKRTSRVLIRLVFFCCVLWLIALVGTLLFNGRDTIRIAFGRDPLGEFKVSQLQTRTAALVEGNLAAGVSLELRKLLQAHPEIRVIHLNSPGGWVAEGNLLRALIEEKKLGTYTDTGCYSACTIAFIAGTHRAMSAKARLGFHAFRMSSGDAFFLRPQSKQFEKQLRALGVSDGFLAKAMTTPASDMWFPNSLELWGNHLIDEIVR